MSELVTDYMEHAVPLRTRLDMWWHLLRCDACRRYFEQVRRTIRLVGQVAGRPPDAATEERTLAAVRERPRPDTR